MSISNIEELAKATENSDANKKPSKPLEVGQEVFYRPLLKYGDKSDSIKSATIHRVGRKYAFVNIQGREMGFDKEKLMYCNPQYTQFNIKFYLSEQEILDEREYHFLAQELRRFFAGIGKQSGFSLEQLRAAYRILCGDKTTEQQ